MTLKESTESDADTVIHTSAEGELCVHLCSIHVTQKNLQRFNQVHTHACTHMHTHTVYILTHTHTHTLTFTCTHTTTNRLEI